MQNKNYLSRDKTQALIDGLGIKQNEGQAFLQGLADKGYTIEGYNDQTKTPEPTMMDSLKSRLSDIGNKQTETIQNSARLYKEGKQGILPTIGQTVGASIGAAGESFSLPINEAVSKAISFVGEYAPENIKQAATELAQKGIELTKPSIEAYNALPEGERANIKAVGDLMSGVTNLAIGGQAAKGIGQVVGASVNTAPKLAQETISKAKSVTDNLVSRVTPAPVSPTRALGQIAQGTTEDIQPVAKALAILDTSKVKTFDELNNQIDKTIPNLAKKVDEELLKDAGVYSLTDLALPQTTNSGKVIKTDFVTRALDNLSELYKSIGDDVARVDIEDIINKAQTSGLTRKEINDISRIYGQEFGRKAFSKTGDPLTSVNAQAFENVRSGLKQVARQGIGGTEAKMLDEQLSSLYDTQRLVEKNVEAVNKLKQKIQDRGLLENLTHTAFKALDMMSAGTIRGVIGGLLPRGAGYKTMNALDIEDALRGNLDIVEKALKTSSDKDLMKLLNSSFQKSDLSNSSLVKKTMNSTKTTANNINMSSSVPQTTKKANKASIPKELQPLAEEAKKYKSAEEFVKNQQVFYHGTYKGNTFDKFDMSKSGTGAATNYINQGDQIYVTSNKDAARWFSKEVNDKQGLRTGTIDYSKPQQEGTVLEFYLPKNSKIKRIENMPTNEADASIVLNQAKKEGYDAVTFEDKAWNTIEGDPSVLKMFKDGKAPDTTIILDEKKLLPKKQLIDLYNKVNSKK